MIVTAVMATALVAASAAVGAARPSPERAAARHSGSHALSTAVRTLSPDVVFHAPFPSTPIATPLYVYAPAPTTAVAPPDPNTVNCAASGTDCTPAQECDIWNEC